MKIVVLALLLAGLHLTAEALTKEAPRRERLLEKGWKFSRSDSAAFASTDFDDSGWQSVVVPHDWAIYGPFSSLNDPQHTAITQDGQKDAMRHEGRTGGLPFTGVGWYRLRFEAPKSSEGKRVTLLFDGAMSNAQVFVNGREAGRWAYGYNTFYLDITEYVNNQGVNTLAVRLENLPESARWYPGAGLYRNVHLIVNDEAHIPLWGTQITTPVVRAGNAKVVIRTKLDIPNNLTSTKIVLEANISDYKGNKISIGSSPIDMALLDNNGCYEQTGWLDKPSLWSPDNPALYNCVTKLYIDGELKDSCATSFGVRSIEFRPDDGFYLNGVKTKFRGVCNHHDLGPLGAAVNDAAIRRQVRILKDMGCNAIRTSHNMPAPELVRACDEMGMMLMVEAFDELKARKCDNGYNIYYNEYAEKDLVNMVRQYRNNPSVVMWSIANEVAEQTAAGGVQIARWLQNICHREDPTRPVTSGMNHAKRVINNNFAATLDVVGINYNLQTYEEAYAKLPQQLVLGSETASTVSSRGVYKFPVGKRVTKYDDHQCSSYDLERCGWSELPDDDFAMQEDHHYCIGEFVWTGFDYLGEPTPYYSDWPSHSSVFGIIDLAGIPKDRYYLYRSHWNPTVETLHILPHWTWHGREGETTPVFVYTNYPSAELFINGISQGVRRKGDNIAGNDTVTAALYPQNRYRLMWMDTKYEPGTLKVVAYDKEGKAVAEKELHTAGKPHHIELAVDRTEITADGRDMAFIRVRVVDAKGNLCPDDSRQISFSVKGAGVYRAAANGDPTNLELFHLPQMSLFKGELTAIVQSAEKAGEIVFEASAKSVKTARLKIVSLQR